MKKRIYTPLFSLFCCVLIAFTAFAGTTGGIPDNTPPGDYQFISVYELTPKNDTTASYTSRSAHYYPMDGTVVVGGSSYDIETNPNYNQKKEPTADFRYIVGSYYTNLD